MHCVEDYPYSATEGESSGCGPPRKVAPQSPHSHSSSAVFGDEVSYSELPVSCFKAHADIKLEPNETVLGPLSTAFQSANGTLSRSGNMSQLARTTPFSPGEKLPTSSGSRQTGSQRKSSSNGTSSATAADERREAGSESDNSGGHVSRWHCAAQESPVGSDATHKHNGVSFDGKKRKWRPEAKYGGASQSPATSVSYFESEKAAAGACDRTTSGPCDHEGVATYTPTKPCCDEKPPLSRRIADCDGSEEAAFSLDRTRLPRKKFNSRQRTSQYLGVGSSNRKNQWQARILVHGKVTHLGYYETEQEAARVYDRVALSVNGPEAQTNFPPSHYAKAGLGEFRNMAREELQRALGVKPMDKSSRFRGVSRKKGKWEAKVMVNRKWAFRALFDGEAEAARAYDAAVWRLKPKEAVSFVNFKDGMAARIGKRPGRHGPGLTRTKSQRLESQSSAGSLPGVHPNSLSLMPEDLDELDSPFTPTRRHSVQLPVISQPPEEMPKIARHGSMAAGAQPAMLPAEEMPSLQPEELSDQADELLALPTAVSGQQQQQQQQVHLHDISPQQSSFSRRSSYGQLQSTLSGVPLVPLPDPNSIGVPPPSGNLPYPELVGIPTAPNGGPAEAVEHSSTLQLPPAGQQVSNMQPAMASAQGTGLPEIPAPLLPAEASRLGMANYYRSTPLSHGLRQAMSSGANHMQEYLGEGHAEHATPNPFLAASGALPPISPTNDVLVRVGSEAHMLQEPRPTIQKLPSMTPSLDCFPTAPTQPLASMPSMPSMNSHALQRAASESILRALPGTPVDRIHHSQPVGLQVEGLGGPCLSSLSHQGSPLMQPPPGVATAPVREAPPHVALARHGSLPMADRMLGLPPSGSVFNEYTGRQIGSYGSAMPSLQQLPDSFGGMPGSQAAHPELLSGMLGNGNPSGLHRSMSTSNLMQPHPHQYGCREGMSLPPRASSQQLFTGLQPAASLDGPTQFGYPPLQNRGLGSAQISTDHLGLRPCDDPGEEDLIADLGVLDDLPDCTPQMQLQDVQIGGEELSLFGPKTAAQGPF